MSAPQNPWVASGLPRGPITGCGVGVPLRVVVWEYTTAVISSTETVPQPKPFRLVRRTRNVPEAKSAGAQDAWLLPHTASLLTLPSAYQT